MRNNPTDLTTNDDSSKSTTSFGRQGNVKDEAEYKAREEEKRRKREKEEERARREKEEEERARREKEEEERERREKEAAAGWAMNEPTAGSASRSRLRIRAILEKQAKQRVGIAFLVFLTLLTHLTFGSIHRRKTKKNGNSRRVSPKTTCQSSCGGFSDENSQRCFTTIKTKISYSIFDK